MYESTKLRKICALGRNLIKMLDYILNALVYVLAIYGLIEIIKTIFYIMEYTNLSEDRYIHNNRG